VSRKTNPEDLSVEELRRLLIEKRRSARAKRLERFRQTGRVVTLVPEEGNTGLQDLRSAEWSEEEPALRYTVRSRSSRILSSLLLFVEIAAVLILIFVLVNGFDLIRELNREVSLALEQPTFTATPLIVAAILPSGHTPPDQFGISRPNDAEIPEHLRPLVQSLADIPVPTPGPEQAIRIQIPALNIDAPIVQGDGWEQLKKGVGQHIGSADPGRSGNLVLSAHNDIFGEIFRHLDQLKSGDEIIIYTNQRAYTYIVSVTKIVEPTQVEVMAGTADPIATLISCWPYLVDDQRIVVQAVLKDG